MLVSYDVEEYDFAGIVAADVFRVASLADLHLTASQRLGRERLTAAESLAYRALLAQMPDTAPFYRLYQRFVSEVLAPPLRAVSYTAHPTFRVHFPDSSTISAWHRDVDVTGRNEQINVWLPLVDVAGPNTIWIESHYDRGDFAPYPVRYGEFLLFDGGFLAHGSVPNETSVTRVSFDLRVTPHPNSRLASSILGTRPVDLRPPAVGGRSIDRM